MKNILDTAVYEGMFDRLVKAWFSVGMEESLVNDGPFTVFAPTDKAFERMPVAALEELVRDKRRLREVLSYHVVSGKVTAEQVTLADCLTSVQGRALCFDLRHGIRVQNARIVQTDIECSNGVIHAIDKVLLPDVIEPLAG